MIRLSLPDQLFCFTNTNAADFYPNQVFCVFPEFSYPKTNTFHAAQRFVSVFAMLE